MVGELDPEKKKIVSRNLLVTGYNVSNKVLVPSSKATCHLIYDYVPAFTTKFYFVNHVDCHQLGIIS